MAVCCLDEPGAWVDEVTRLGVGVTVLGRRPGFDLRLCARLARVADAHQAAIIHCHHYSPFVYGALARLWRPSTRVVFTEHGRLSNTLPSQKRRLANLLLSRLSRDIFAVSRELRQHLLGEGFPDGNVKTIYNGVELGTLPDDAVREKLRSELGISPDTLLVGSIARFDPVKDLGTLLAAVAGVRNSGVAAAILLVGDGPERVQLESLARSLGMLEVTHFLGQRTDARRWLAACDVYVNSSISEGVSLTILEAMAAAIPVIATDVGGTPEVVTAACGILVPARSPQGIAANLKMLAFDPLRRQKLGEAGRQRVAEAFAIERMVDRYRAVYTAT